jgi:hypothetical protein
MQSNAFIFVLLAHLERVMEEEVKISRKISGIEEERSAKKE